MFLQDIDTYGNCRLSLRTADESRCTEIKFAFQTEKTRENFSSITIRVLKFEANFHTLGNKYFLEGVLRVLLAIFFILIQYGLKP